MKIVSICFAGFVGANMALKSLSRAVRLSRHFALSSPLPDSPEIKFFAHYLREARPALVILGAWTPAYDILLNALHPDTEAAVYWTSSTGQVDISGEAPLLTMILDHPRIRYRFFASHTFAKALCTRPDCLELPPTIPVSAQPPPRHPNPVPIISLFCSPNEYRRKNIFNSIAAVGMQTHACILHLNGLSENPDYRRMLDMFPIRYRDWGWMSARQYRRVLARVDIGLQVSFAESFNYVAADHMQRGIPILASRMVPALNDMTARTQKRCVVDNPDDPVEIAAKLKYLLAHPIARQSLGNNARRQLLRTNEENISRAKTLLCQIV